MEQQPCDCQRCRIINVFLTHDPTYGWLCKECVTQVQIDELKSHCERLEERIEELEGDRKHKEETEKNKKKAVFREVERKNAIFRTLEEDERMRNQDNDYDFFGDADRGDCD